MVSLSKFDRSSTPAIPSDEVERPSRLECPFGDPLQGMYSFELQLTTSLFIASTGSDELFCSVLKII